MARIHLDHQEIKADGGATVMEAMAAAGLLLRSDCGGHGRCGKCVVQVKNPERSGLSSPDPEERRCLGERGLDPGLRLACRARVCADAELHVLPKSRLSPDVVQKGLPDLLPPMRPPAAAAPAAGAGQEAFGIAVDIGTTTLAVYLCHLHSGTLAAAISVRNPQSLFGEDVMSRISAIQRDPQLLPRMHTLVVKAIDWAVTAVCRQVGIASQTIGSAVAVGNSTMVHLLLGQSPASIGTYPYAPAFVDGRTLPAGRIGLGFNPDAQLRTLPLVSGHIGADLVAAALAQDLPSCPPGTLLVDVGTNGELILLSSSGLWTSSCATGPALEGATLKCGMQAASGAVDKVRLDRASGLVNYTLIQRDAGSPPKAAGICGSGVLSIVAELLRHGVIDRSGRFNRNCGCAGLRLGDRKAPAFEIVPGSESEGGRPIVFSQQDVRAVQLAKGALRAGLDLLCAESGLARPDRILLAGAFGSSIDKADVIEIGLFPDLDPGRIEVVGNAAGAGAVISLFRDDTAAAAEQIARSARVVDLSTHPRFQDAFVRALSF